jgi:hypothetical protein
MWTLRSLGARHACPYTASQPLLMTRPGCRLPALKTTTSRGRIRVSQRDRVSWQWSLLGHDLALTSRGMRLVPGIWFARTLYPEGL